MPAGESDVNFLEWLADTVSKAAKTAEAHQKLQSAIESLCASIEVKHNLLYVQVGVNHPWQDLSSLLCICCQQAVHCFMV